jgi:cytochrome c oxidase assembly protein subunit 15
VTALARFAWSLLAYNLAVILWGAFVRASGSGAGCGSHWPLCNGEVVPHAPALATVIELTHRATSGLALLGVVVLVWWTWRATSKGHPARFAAAMSLLFMLTEAAVGAGLVLFELVADNASLARGLFMAVHLVNTFILLGWLTLTAWWLSGGRQISVSGKPFAAATFAVATAGLLLAGMSGAIAALGDTLYPARSLTEGLRADLSATSHVLIRLRLLHPIITTGVGILLIVIASRRRHSSDDHGRHAPNAVVTLTLVQLTVGVLNVVWLAPVWMQLVHLFIADLLWIAFVLLAVSALGVPAPETARGAAALGPEPADSATGFTARTH